MAGVRTRAAHFEEDFAVSLSLAVLADLGEEQGRGTVELVSPRVLMRSVRRVPRSTVSSDGCRTAVGGVG
ncbi:hypothetical protein CJ179_01860 [Rhodococcus sp. ACS1]|nr:hypothetical protein CJ179_01860 [Rhodococcus sp. ACS1]